MGGLPGSGWVDYLQTNKSVSPLHANYLKFKKYKIINRVSKLNADYTIEFLTIKTSKQNPS
jgi:hypothetical protein